VDKLHKQAPIKFVTTGIFAIAARFGWLDPLRDCVLVDEGHVTIESAEGVELAIAICRQRGIPVHYMSATVDTANLHETLGVRNIVDATKIQRAAKWMHNIAGTMEEHIVDLVEKTLIHPDPTSAYFPQGEGVAREIRDAVLSTGRAKGFLIIVNSFAGEDSDANKIASLLEQAPYAKEIEILLLASEVIKNPKRKKAFDTLLSRLEQEKKKYVIIATSAVEMGITFPTLDFVATMNSGYEQVTIGDTVLPQIVPLPVNSLLQRIGRVGRKFPGIGYITREVDAYYSSLSDNELNSQLQYEPIRLPLRKGSLTLVAQYSFREAWEDPIAGLEALNLPSGIHKVPERVEEFLKQRQKLLDLGVAVDNRLTEGGRYCERWLEGSVDLGYAIALQEALAREDKEDLFFYLVAGALSSVTLSVLADKDAGISTEPLADRFNTHTGKKRQRKGVIRGGRDIELPPQSELLALYNIVAYFSNKYAEFFFNRKSLAQVLQGDYQKTLAADCAAFGFDPEKVEDLLKGFTSILKTFCDTNGSRPCFKSLFGEVRSLHLADLTFPTLTEWDIQRFMKEVETLPGRTRIVLTEEENGFSWQEVEGERGGMLYRNATCLALEDGDILTAKLVPLPGRGERKVGEAWKIVHTQQVSLREHAIPKPQQEPDEEAIPAYEPHVDVSVTVHVHNTPASSETMEQAPSGTHSPEVHAVVDVHVVVGPTPHEATPPGIAVAESTVKASVHLFEAYSGDYRPHRMVRRVKRKAKRYHPEPVWEEEVKEEDDAITQEYAKLLRRTKQQGASDIKAEDKQPVPKAARKKQTKRRKPADAVSPEMLNMLDKDVQKFVQRIARRDEYRGVEISVIVSVACEIKQQFGYVCEELFASHIVPDPINETWRYERKRRR